MKTFSLIRSPFIWLTALAMAAAPAAAHAADNKPAPADPSSVARLNEEGAALYAVRDYRHAIEKFIQAYAIDSDPNLLFNIARCYEELGEIDAAIEKYETFLKTPGADARGRQRARESLTVLREARGQPTSGATSPAPPAAAPTEVAAEPSPSDPGGEAEASALPWLVLGGSAAFAVAGTTFYLLGASDHGQVTDAPGYGDSSAVANMTRRQADDLVASGDTKKLIGGIGFGLAGALAATYVVLLVSADDEAEPGPSLAVSLSPAAGGSSLLVQGSF